MKPLIVAKQDIAGGAARAASRLALALRDAGIPCEMLVGSKASDYPWVLGRGSFSRDFRSFARAYAGAALLRLQKGRDADARSINLLPSRLDRTINTLPHDVVNLHWSGGELMSVEAIGRITKPVVWTLHDMWAFCGAEHYAPDGAEARWRTGYDRENRPAGAQGLDLDRLTWQRKRKAWRRPQHVVVPTRWLADCARKSALMRGWPVHVVPNTMDLDRFRPWPRDTARAMLGLPAEVPLIGFGAMGGTRDPRKGWDLLRAALSMVAAAGTGAEAVIFGQSRPATPPLGTLPPGTLPPGTLPDVPMPCHFTGHLSDDIALALLYSAVDLVVVSSRQDNLPQTATEPQACGCPVVAFDTGGLPDTLQDGKTGLLAPAFDTAVLARHIVTLLGDPELRARQGAAARTRAEALWAPATIAGAYQAVYAEAMDAPRPPQH